MHGVSISHTYNVYVTSTGTVCNTCFNFSFQGRFLKTAFRRYTHLRQGTRVPPHLPTPAISRPRARQGHPRREPEQGGPEPSAVRPRVDQGARGRPYLGRCPPRHGETRDCSACASPDCGRMVELSEHRVVRFLNCPVGALRC